MEGGIASARGGRLAVVALAAIAGVTVAWWALALWPVPATGPEWLVRTRAVCFGVEPGGLPNAGGWVLLVSQPASMLVMLLVVWGDAVRAGFAGAARSVAGRAALVVSAVFVVTLVALAGWRVRSALAAHFDPNAGDLAAAVTRLRGAPPALALVDQHGAKFTLAAFAGRPVLVTFAYGHCETVCPLIVREALVARRRSGVTDAVLVIVTLDPQRDTPDRLAYLARRWQLRPGDRVAGGRVADVERMLGDWRIPHARDPVTGDVAHSTVVYLIDRDGRAAYRVEGSVLAVVALLQRL